MNKVPALGTTNNCLLHSFILVTAINLRNGSSNQDTGKAIQSLTRAYNDYYTPAKDEAFIESLLGTSDSQTIQLILGHPLRLFMKKSEKVRGMSYYKGDPEWMPVEPAPVPEFPADNEDISDSFIPTLLGLLGIKSIRIAANDGDQQSEDQQSELSTTDLLDATLNREPELILHNNGSHWDIMTSKTRLPEPNDERQSEISKRSTSDEQGELPDDLKEVYERLITNRDSRGLSGLEKGIVTELEAIEHLDRCKKLFDSQKKAFDTLRCRYIGVGTNGAKTEVKAEVLGQDSLVTDIVTKKLLDACKAVRDTIMRQDDTNEYKQLLTAMKHTAAPVGGSPAEPAVKQKKPASFWKKIILFIKWIFHILSGKTQGQSWKTYRDKYQPRSSETLKGDSDPRAESKSGNATRPIRPPAP
ncbi:hypothetical protein MMH89_00035 [Candidatus Comchoanobacter bicostacola]|uniref:Uncharacterized protein n=1 Tax=Candidatus Comchoanobacter bicostacola TaxID=2919598 RepID=A0ABY5DIZ6_9GAMM|nr:hypothetical protein [Candidatus Comchoanobacter bicostacola]UTC24556.1 hypothetical protein MMH89_00035 [Candidatus Comchoanobacter bicostacola]